MRTIACCLIATILASAAGREADISSGRTPIAAETFVRVPTTHKVNMVGDGAGYRFEPAELVIEQGDSISYVMVSGGPHNVAFDARKVPDDAKVALNEGMPDRISDFSGKFLVYPSDTYTISFARVPAGVYEYFCAPHLAMRQLGKVTVVVP